MPRPSTFPRGNAPEAFIPPPDAPRKAGRNGANTASGKPASETRVVRLGATEVPYQLKRSERRRRVGLLVDDRGLVVMAPQRSSDQHIDKVLQEGAGWIHKKLAHWRVTAPPARQWGSGGQVDFFGDQLLLEVIASGPRPSVLLRDGGRLEVGVADPADETAVKLAIVQWYKRHAQHHLPERVEYFARQLNLRKLPRTFISGASTRWGSCTADRTIRLSWRLMQASTQVIDYVAAHEVSHIMEMNHSPRFWQVVERLCPDYSGARAELDAMTRHYMGW